MQLIEFDGLKFQTEGENTRVTSENINFLFGFDLEKVLAAYKYFAPNARDYFKQRWESAPQPNLDEQDFNWLIKKITLHWMYFYIINQMPVEIKNSDLDHPQTREIIQRIVERSFQAGSNEAIGLCAKLMGISKNEYLNWRKGWELYTNR